MFIAIITQTIAWEKTMMEGYSISPNLVGIQAVVGWCYLLKGQAEKRSCGTWLEVTASDWGTTCS